MHMIMIRHGMTKGNQEKRYVGSTDEELSTLGIAQIEELKKTLDKAKLGKYRVFTSPMLRCKQTAAVLFPGQEYIEIPQFRECAFGEFEYKNYLELREEPAYQKYIDSNGEAAFPGGESKKDFCERCLLGFDKVMKLAEQGEYDTLVLVVHGGTIMALLDALSEPHKSYFSWQLSTGEAYEMQVELQKGKRPRLTDIAVRDDAFLVGRGTH